MRRFELSLILGAALAAGLGLSAACAQPPRLVGQRPDLDQLAGVYKHQFPNATVQGDHYTSEDVFEVVKLSPASVYFRIHTQFYNGHECSLWGIADLAQDALVYKESAIHAQGFGPKPVTPCTMRFTVTKDGVLFDDVDGRCRAENCGARGLFGFGDRVDFAFKDRRRIRYLPLILASKEYAEAVKDRDGAWRPGDDR